MSSVIRSQGDSLRNIVFYKQLMFVCKHVFQSCAKKKQLITRTAVLCFHNMYMYNKLEILNVVNNECNMKGWKEFVIHQYNLHINN